MFWQVTIGRQKNILSENCTTSYANPNIEVIDPPPISTHFNGGNGYNIKTKPGSEEYIQLIGTNFGLSDPYYNDGNNVNQATLLFEYSSSMKYKLPVVKIILPNHAVRDNNNLPRSRVLWGNNEGCPIDAERFCTGAEHQVALTVPPLECDLDCDANNFTFKAIG